MTQIRDIILFRKMIAPAALQFLFWAGVGGCFYGGYVLWVLDVWAWPFPVILGPILLRVATEFALVTFRIHEQLVQISNQMPKSPKNQ
ncbi:MAG: hypothetical protein HWE25_03050 [Alphaproteobacteria bacterium]|nr:hypothetical protein [Alphaproteobacteria bacterium]